MEIEIVEPKTVWGPHITEAPELSSATRENGTARMVIATARRNIGSY
jgi:hypothetical protein